MTLRNAMFVSTAALLCSLAAGFAQSPVHEPVMKLATPHWLEVGFDPQFPHGRHTQNPLPGNVLRLPLPESLMIKGQTGQTSDNKADTAEFRIPLPDAASDAGIDEIVLLANIEGAGAYSIKIEGKAAVPAGCPKDLCSGAVIPEAELARMKAFKAELTQVTHPAELNLEFKTNEGASLVLHGADAPDNMEPVILVHTKSAIEKSAGWQTNEPTGIDLPRLAPLFDQFLRDTSICLAADSNYYMTGTTGGPEMMVVTSDLSVWKSPDLVHWTPVREVPRQSTVVWNIDRDGTWMKPITMRDGEAFRPLWAPEIHYLKNTFWIPFSVPRHGITILRSTSGKAEGPYEIAIKPDEPLSTGIDASLFQDDDGAVYSLYGGGWIARMKPDMTGLAEPYRHITSASGREVGFEGVYLFKDKGRYYLSAADFVLGDYNTYIISSSSLNGPWSERYLAVPHGGHGNFFRDKDGQMWSTFFGNDRHAPFHAKPGIVPMKQDAAGRWRPDLTRSSQNPLEPRRVSQAPGAIGPSNGEPQEVGVMPSSLPH